MLGQLPFREVEISITQLTITPRLMGCCLIVFPLQHLKRINQLGVETLTKAGARFQKGFKNRGRLPEFGTKQIFAGQDKSGAAATRESLKLSKAFNLVSELRKRLQRPAVKHDDLLNTFNLQQRASKTIAAIKKLSWWNPEFHLHDDALYFVQTELHKMIVDVKPKEKRQRIASWKAAMEQGTTSKNVSQFVFQWIKNKTKINGPNLIKSADGNIISDPQKAFDEINVQWDSIFGVNALHQDPHDIFKVTWPIVEKIRLPTSVPELNGEMLRNQALKRNIDAAPRIDGWRTSEIKMLPLQAFDSVAKFFKDVEENRRQLPKILCSVRQVILDKGGSDTYTPTKTAYLTITHFHGNLHLSAFQATCHVASDCDAEKSLWGHKRTQTLTPSN